MLVPRIFGDKVPQQSIATRNAKVQRRIVMLHDYFRTKVEPPASNMLSMVSAMIFFVETVISKFYANFLIFNYICCRSGILVLHV